MTIEELRDFLNELVETNPGCKDKVVKIERWETIYPDSPISYQNRVYDSVLDVSYGNLTDEEILVIEGEW